MIDSYRQKILERLAGRLDPDLFEDRVIELLQRHYPRLVPIRGGWDFGRDGEFVDDEGKVHPFLATTQEDVARNLTRSLDRYLQDGGPRDRQVVLATSRSLSPRYKKKLKRAAEERGLELLPIHDRQDLANRLARDSRLAFELLEVTGEPPALSSVPQTRGLLREDLKLVGRDADLDWLRQSSGDRLIVGQPGSGKTFLALQLVREGRALFLASDNEQWIAEAYGDLDPAVVIVDDAHLSSERLVRLRHLRENIGARFEILATAWPSFEDEIVLALGGIQRDRVRRLELLTRAQILQVYRGVGVQVPDDHPQMHELVNQAANKPGLAVLIGTLALRNEWPDLLSGEAIRQTLIPAFERVMGHDPTDLLACFALGGDRGVAMDDVANFLRLDRSEARSRVIQAAQGGVLHEDGSRMSVQPSALRAALLRQVFFGRFPHPFTDLFQRIEHKDAAVDALAEAARRGVEIPREALRELIGQHGSSRAWAGFAALGGDESRWVLENYAGQVLDIIHPALQRAPHAAIRKLLQLCEAPGAMDDTSSRPLRPLEDWLTELDENGQSGLPSVLHRREIVIEVAEQVLDRGGRADVALLAAFMALSPRLETSRETATGSAVVWHQGYLSIQTVPRMAEIWSSVLTMIENWTAELWAGMETVIREWASPDILGRELDDEPYRDLARKMVEDLGQRFSDRPGLLQALARWRFLLDMERMSAADEEFRILFPLQAHLTPENWSDERERQDREAADLARAWTDGPAVKVADRLFRFEQEAEVFLSGAWITSDSFYGTLAREVEDPQKWFRELSAIGLNPHYAPYLLRRIMTDQREGWEQLVEEYLRDERFSSLVSLLIITAQGVSGPLLEQALSSSTLEPFQVGAVCLRGEVPPEKLVQLLRHPRREISAAAAINEWLAEPKGEVRNSLKEDWEEAIRRSATLEERPDQSTDFWLAAILSELPDLSFDWMANYLRGLNRSMRWRPEKVLTGAAQAMTTEQRIRLLPEADPASGDALGWVVKLIVGSSVEVFRALLAIEPLRDHHLAPLQGRPPDETWAALARLALGAGHSSDQIAGQAYVSAGAYSGFGESHWNKWREAFSRLARSDQPELRVIAEHGLQEAENFLNRSRAMKRQFELTGLF